MHIYARGYSFSIHNTIGVHSIGVGTEGGHMPPNIFGIL